MTLYMKFGLANPGWSDVLCIAEKHMDGYVPVSVKDTDMPGMVRQCIAKLTGERCTIRTTHFNAYGVCGPSDYTAFHVKTHGRDIEFEPYGMSGKGKDLDELMRGRMGMSGEICLLVWSSFRDEFQWRKKWARNGG